MYMRKPLEPSGWLDRLTMCHWPSRRSGEGAPALLAFLSASATCARMHRHACAHRRRSVCHYSKLGNVLSWLIG